MEDDADLLGNQPPAASPLSGIVMPRKLRMQAEQLRLQLQSLHQQHTDALLGEQVRLCAAKLGEAVAIFASLKLHSAMRRLQAERSLAEQLRLCADEVARLSDAIDEMSLRRQDVHGSYLRDAFGVSALSLRS